MARSTAMSVVGVETTTRFAMPSSMRVGSATAAAPTNDSPGMNMTTSSGADGNCSQYALAARIVMCSRTCFACRASAAVRSSSLAAATDSRYAASGTFASTIMSRPPGRWTIMSGAQTPLLSLDRDLLDVIAVLHHPRQLDDPVERDLAP